MNFQAGSVIRNTIPVIPLLFVVALLSAQQHATMSIQQLTDSIRTIVKNDRIPGLMVGITTKDAVLFSGGFGYADITAGRPVHSGTLFRLGSITKMFVSMAILKLVAERKLALEDELKKVAPEVPFKNKWETLHPVRLINLLEHTAGFDDMKLNRMCSQQKTEYTDREMMLLQQPSMVCRWKPGERFAYSNPGYVILGYIIEKITGKSFNRYITENILLPLGMNHSNFNLYSKLPETDTRQYVVHSGKIIEVPSVTSLMRPAGSLWSCADDMVKFLRLFLADGQPLLLAISLQEMETVHSSLAAKSGLASGYALANENLLLFHRAAWRGHTGLMGTCFSTCAYNRQLGVGFILSSNGNQQNYRIEQLITDYLEQLEPPTRLATTVINSKQVTPFLGQYQFENPRNEISGFKDKLLNTPVVYIENNKLFVKPLFGEKQELVQASSLQFAYEGANSPTIIFTKNEEGENVMVMDGAYYIHVAATAVRARFWITAIAVFFAALAVPAGIIYLIGLMTGRLKRNKWHTGLLPAVAVLMLVWAVVNLLQVQDESYLLSELTKIDARSFIIFSGTLLFGVFSLLHLISVLHTLRQFNNRLVAVYWLATALSICYITFILFQNGWIGLRTWAM